MSSFLHWSSAMPFPLAGFSPCCIPWTYVPIMYWEILKIHNDGTVVVVFINSTQIILTYLFKIQMLLVITISVAIIIHIFHHIWRQQSYLQWSLLVKNPQHELKKMFVYSTFHSPETHLPIIHCTSSVLCSSTGSPFSSGFNIVHFFSCRCLRCLWCKYKPGKISPYCLIYK